MIRNRKAASGLLRSAVSSPQAATVPATSQSNRIRTIFDLHSRASSSRPTVSVVICTRERPNDLRSCLESVARLTPPPEEVIVVDNSTGDLETEQLSKAFGVRCVVEESVGLSRARNRGIRECRCEIVAYLDDDCLPDPEWLEYLLRPFSHSKVAAVAGEIIRFTDLKAEQLHKPSTSQEMRYLSRETKRWFEMACFGGVGSGGNMAFRKAACSEIVLFDERLGRGAPFRIAEENCAFALLLAKGCSTVRVPTARVYHPIKQKDVGEEAKSSIAYWLLLFSKFPENRADLLHFLVRRILRRPVAWRFETEQPGSIISSRLSVRFRALTGGIALFLRAR